jgi:hypothetical protein
VKNPFPSLRLLDRLAADHPGTIMLGLALLEAAVTVRGNPVGPIRLTEMAGLSASAFRIITSENCKAMFDLPRTIWNKPARQKHFQVQSKGIKATALATGTGIGLGITANMLIKSQFPTLIFATTLFSLYTR